MAAVKLVWERDGSGYEIEGRSEYGIDLSAPTPWQKSGGVEVVRKRGAFRLSHPLNCDGVWKQLADCYSPNDIAAFCSRWGLLKAPRAHSEAVGIGLARATWLRDLANKAEAGEWEEISEGLDYRSKGPFGAIGKMGLTLRPPAENDGPELHFTPHSLDAAICVQALMDLTGSSNLRKCANPACPEWFKYGSGTNHRKTAMYCRPKCQKAHDYVQRKQASQ